MTVGVIYVVRSPSGLRKVGLTIDVKSRLASIAYMNAIGETGEFFLEHARECPRDLLKTAEFYAHSLLDDDNVKTEWFNCRHDVAVMAVDAAVLSAILGIAVPSSHRQKRQRPAAKPIDNTGGMITGKIIRAAIGLLGWQIKDLSDRSGVPWATVQRMQAGDGIPRQSYERVAAVQKALEEAGVEFIDDRGVALRQDRADA